MDSSEGRTHGKHWTEIVVSCEKKTNGKCRKSNTTNTRQMDERLNRLSNFLRPFSHYSLLSTAKVRTQYIERLVDWIWELLIALWSTKNETKLPFDVQLSIWHAVDHPRDYRSFRLCCHCCRCGKRRHLKWTSLDQYLWPMKVMEFEWIWRTFFLMRILQVIDRAVGRFGWLVLAIVAVNDVIDTIEVSWCLRHRENFIERYITRAHAERFRSQTRL